MQPDNAILSEARALFASRSYGVLSTHSQDMPGYPFGSITPYSLDRRGDPVILISDLAQHTKNLLANPKVALTVMQASDEEVQAHGRLTCLAEAAALDDGDQDASERYFRYFPKARDYAQAHRFFFYRLSLTRAYYIGGFGKIFWLEARSVRCANPFSASEEKRILDHMNEDHQAAMRRYFGSYKNLTVHAHQTVTMVGIDTEGFDLALEGRRHRFSFTHPIANTLEARHALIEMAGAPQAAQQQF